MAAVDGLTFDIENDLEEQVGALPLPFPGMDKSGAATCVFHLRGSCVRAASCPYRHIKADRTVVCKHWLRGLCKKGDLCEFLHEYDMSKMPECYFYSRFHACSNKECPFLHIDPESKVRDCPWYDRGFCRHGPNCRHRHTRRVSCLNYICGFCPEGPDCKFVHMRFDLPISGESAVAKKGTVVCHYCNQMGHKIYQCPSMPAEQREEAIQHKLNQLQSQAIEQHTTNHNMNHNINHNPNQQNSVPILQMSSVVNESNISSNFKTFDNKSDQKERVYRPLDQVTCFKCGEKGHYANKCPKGHLAFLSSALKELQTKRDTNSDI